MSVSVDDLVASLSANHIGQEATDLVALQAQLAQTLSTHPLPLSPTSSHSPAIVHGVSVNIVRRDPTSVQHCTTPTARTPSSASCSWPLSIQDQTAHTHRRSLSHTRPQCTDDGWYDHDEMAEERTVEDMVVPDSPRTQTVHPWSSHRADTHTSVTRTLTSSVASTPLSLSNTTFPTDACPSLFTSTDPFYLQASQPQPQTQTSFFSHVGRPSSHSPFLVGVPTWE